MPTHAYIYSWPTSQICEGCNHAEEATVYADDPQNVVICYKPSSLNDGLTCPDKETDDDLFNEEIEKNREEEI